MRKAFFISGGLGKTVAFSALTKALAEKYGECIIVNPYPEVFFNNPYVFRNFNPNQPYIYEDYLKNCSCSKLEPYDMDSYRLENNHLIDVFAQLAGVDNVPHEPLLFFTPEEERQMANDLARIVQKPYILVQFFGGVSYYDPNSINQKICFARDYKVELAQKLVNEIHVSYPDYPIIQVRLVTEPMLKNVLPFNEPISARALFGWVKFCRTFIAIDSSVQHISAAFKKRGIVLWGGTNPKKLGYSHNVNLSYAGTLSCKMPFCHRPETHFADNENGKVWTCKHDYQCMNIDTKQIMEKLSDILKS